MAINNTHQNVPDELFYNERQAVNAKLPRVYNAALLEDMRDVHPDAQNPFTRQPWPLKKPSELASFLKKVRRGGAQKKAA